MDDEFTKAFNEEFDVPTDDKPEVEETPEVENTPAPEVEDTPTPEAEDTTPEPKEDAEPAPDEKVETPQYATKEDIRKALEEDRQSLAERESVVTDMREAVIKHLHPEGIDKQLYDSQNRVINTAQDIVDRGLINPDTNEPFEYEEAAKWMMNAQQTMNKQVADLEGYASEIADVYVDLKEGNDRVEELYGDVLKAMPGVAKQLSEAYFATLVKDEKTGIIVKAQQDPVEFYKLALTPYLKLGEKMAADAEREAEEAKRAKETERDERIGFAPRGSSKSKANTGDPFVDALLDEMED